MVPDKREALSTNYLPDVGDILYICIMQVLLFGRPGFLFQDCSVGWHLLSGQYILEHLQIPRTDIVSFSFPDKAWVPYEWFFDFVANLLVNAGGLNLLAVFCASAIAFVFVRTYDAERSNGAGLALSTVVCIIGVFASAVHWLARPHIFTFLCFSIFISILNKFEQGRLSAKQMIVYLCLTMLLWVNTHPAFPLGVILIGIYLISAFVNGFGQERVKTLLIALATTCATTLLNPNFINLHFYILKYLKGGSVLANTEEFLSPVFHGNIHAFCLELLLIMLIVGLFQKKRTEKVPMSVLLTVIFALHMALSAVRSIPLFVLSSVPLIGFLFGQQERNRNPEEESSSSSLFGRIGSSLAKFDDQEKLSKKRYLSILYTLAIICLAFTPVMKTGFNPETTPTKTLEYINTRLRPEMVGNTGFNFDNWGGLLAYKLKMKVFIDDRADFYGEEFYTEYGTIVQTNPGWQALLDKHKVYWVLMPANSKLVAALSRESRWLEVCKDEAAVIFIRQKQK